MHPAGDANMELDDFGGAVGGTVGGLVAWLRTNTPGWRSLVRLALSGLICGTGSFFVVRWKFPDVPIGVNLTLSALVGIAASPIIELFLLLVNKFSIVATRLVGGWLEHLERRHGPTPAAAGPAGQPADPPAVVVGGRVPAGPVLGVDGDQRVAEGKAERPPETAGG